MNNPVNNNGRDQNNGHTNKEPHPHKSTTHEERYYHINHEGTVFFRKEQDGWYASTVVLDERDTFVRSQGRNAARRKYFQQPQKRRAVLEPTYAVAELLVGDLWIQRLQHRSVSLDDVFGFL